MYAKNQTSNEGIILAERFLGFKDLLSSSFDTDSFFIFSDGERSFIKKGFSLNIETSFCVTTVNCVIINFNPNYFLKNFTSNKNPAICYAVFLLDQQKL